VTSPTPEPTLTDVQREFPKWQCWRAVSGLYYARRADAESGDHAHVKGEDPMDLRDQIIRAESLAHDEQA
jgi:hypothetical protein